jgi:hypothetical protein
LLFGRSATLPLERGSLLHIFRARSQEPTRGTTYAGDLINTRLIFEHILSDKHGFRYNLEFVTLHGVSHRLDGHAINASRKNGFTVIGVEPAVQWRIGDTNFVCAGGVLFT